MNKTNRCLLFLLLLVVCFGCADVGGATLEEHYYAIEVNGVLCGYGHVQAFPDRYEGEETERVEQHMLIMLSALGMEFNTQIDIVQQVDPLTRQYVYHSSKVVQGQKQVALDFEARIDGDVAHVVSGLQGEKRAIELPPGTILGDALYQWHLKRDFVDGDVKSTTYSTLEVADAEVQESTVSLVGREKVELGGKSYDATIVEGLNRKTAIKTKVWIDDETGLMLRFEVPPNRVVYLSDPSVVKRIELGNVDENIIVKVDEQITDVQGIRYMKVRARMKPTGLWVTPESLNVPGQRFVGSVTDNLVEGVFEIEHPLYDGANAPAFPPDFADDSALAEFLAPTGLIESDDRVLIERAQEITRGAEDSWVAATRLSEWVAVNIGYAIPGGGTARKTYDIRAGECGAHSNLVAALCRAVGIPARVVWGCMYSPNFGGAFGQHGWNEVYMGDAGWIPLDSTAFEASYVDSGHIRVGSHLSSGTALNGLEFEVLDYRLEAGGTADVPVEPGKYDAYLGDYTHAEAKRTFTVKVVDGALAVDIPQQVVLALREPDEKGRWYAVMTPRLYVTFGPGDTDSMDVLTIHEIVHMQRTAEAEPDSDVPERFRPYLGKFLLPQVNAEFEVVFKDGSLAVEDPLEKRTIHLQLPDEDGNWVDEFDKNSVSFQREGDGSVSAIMLDAGNAFRRD
ncbi:MAG: transglutaminase domain-containing protein [bacterium]|nr:transglutaminase domain-containing protein [bacterium]